MVAFDSYQSVALITHPTEPLLRARLCREARDTEAGEMGPHLRCHHPGRGNQEL